MPQLRPKYLRKYRKKIQLWAMGLAFLGLGAACQLTDTREGTPLVLQLEAANFSSEAVGPTRTENITDVWVKIIREEGDEFVGVQQLPAQVQIPNPSGARIELAPGIIGDGQSGNRILQTLYKADTLRDLPPAGEVLKVSPSFAYSTARTEIPVPFTESFEGGEPPFELSDAGEFGLTKVPSDQLPERQGGHFGQVSMPPGVQGEGEIFHERDFLLLRRGQKAFLEMSYRSNVPLSVGLHFRTPSGQTGSFYDLVLLPNSEWTQINVDLIEEVNALESGTRFQVAFLADHDGQERHFFDLDNLRLILERP